MEPITDAEALASVRTALAVWVATTVFWVGCVAVIGVGGVYVMAQRGLEFGVPLAILLFTFGSGAWFWIRETHRALRRARGETAAPTLR